MENLLHNKELEMNVIGALCAEPALTSRIAAILSPEDFALDLCREAFAAACKAYEENTPFDALIAADALAVKLGSDQAAEFIKDCITVTPTTANAEYHAELLHGKATARRLSAALLEDLMGAPYGSGAELAASVMERCKGFLEKEQTGRTKSLLDALSDMYQSLGQGATLRVDTGLPLVDSILKGIEGGNLCIIGARPGVGKSALGLSIAEHVARSGGSVIVYSLEMLAGELAERLVARQGIKLDNLIDYDLTQEQYTEIVRICSGLSKLPIWINDAPNMTVDKIRSEALATPNLNLIVVDFLSLMKSGRKFENRNLELGAISRELKNLAAELQVPVIALAQLNRGTSDTEVPTLRSLRDSGELEQNANKILLLWNSDPALHHIGLSVAKNRRGKTGLVELFFDGDHMRFTEIDMIHQEPGRGKGAGWKPSNETLPWGEE